MAEEKKSIEISYKANLSDLLAKLKQIPNVTDQEAKKMVAALDRQLKQAENAAKKAAAASQKAAKQASSTAAMGSTNFRSLADSADHAEDKLRRVGDASGDIDRGFSSIGLALRGVNPQLAEAADGMADAFAVTEGLSMSFSALNPIVLAVAAAVAAVGFAFVSYQQEIEKARQLTLDMKNAQNALNDAYKEQRVNFEDSLQKLNDIGDEYAVLTGEIDKYELATRKAKSSTEKMFEGNIQQQQQIIDDRKTELDLVNRLIDANYKGVVATVAMSDTEKERLRNLQLITKGVDKNKDLTENDLVLNVELFKIQKALNNEIAKQEQGLQIIEKHRKDAVAMALEIQEYENETAKAQENQKNIKQEINVATEEEVNHLENLMKLDLERFHKQQDASVELRKLMESTILSEDEQKELAFQREIERIQKLGETSEQQGKAQEVIDRMVHDKRMEQYEEQLQKQIADQDILVDGFNKFSSAAMDAVLSSGQANKKVIMGLFKMQQAGALAEIAFNTAKAVTAALAYPAPLGPAMSALAIGTGAAQAASVLSQQPPQASFHMGGMAPDETSARVLKGEAILDRATVNRLGGEQGIKQLQQGRQDNSPMVIIQPFKHFGRFTREIGFVPPKQTGIRAY